MNAVELNNTEVTERKQKIRNPILEQRNALTPTYVHKASDELLIIGRLSKQLSTLIDSDDNLKIGTYVAINNEISATVLQNSFNSADLYIPKITSAKLGQMAFTPRQDLADYKNSYGIPETKTLDGQICASQLDVIFLPLVSFDRSGNRLGYGGGFYDRALADFDKHKQPLLIGLAYGFQEHERLPFESFDIKLDMIITNKEHITV